MRSLAFKFFCISFLIVGCSNPPEQTKAKSTTNVSQSKPVIIQKTNSNLNQESESKPANSFKPFYIFSDKGSRDNHYVPSGFMPNGECLQFVDSWSENCFSGSTCLKIVYDVECSREDQRWAGIYWLHPPNNWGTRKGGYNLTGASKLTFWAKGSVGGEQIEEFKLGGIEGNYPDSDVAMIGPVILSGEWKQYSIDLRGKDLSHISGGFAWSANEEMNPGSCTFYLDEMRFE